MIKIRGVGVRIALAGLVLAIGLGIGGTHGLPDRVLSRDVDDSLGVLVGPQLGGLAPSPTPQERAEGANSTTSSRAVRPRVLGVLQGAQPPADIAAAIRAYDWPWDWATATAFCESSFDPRKTGAAGERGLMQIAPVHLARIQRLGFTVDQMYEVGPNIAVAYDLWAEQGETPWKGTSECRGD